MKGSLRRNVILKIRSYSVAVAEYHDLEMRKFNPCSLTDEVCIQNRYWRTVLQEYEEYPGCKDAYDALMTSSPTEWIRDFEDYVIPLILT